MRRTTYHLVGIIAIGLAITTGCGRFDNETTTRTSNADAGDPSPATILLTVGKHTFTGQDFNSFRTRFTANLDTDLALGDAEQTALLKHYVDNRLLVAAARDEGITPTPEDRRSVQTVLEDETVSQARLADDEILAHILLKRELGSRIDVTEDEMKTYYRENQSDFNSENVYHVKEILVEDENLAKQIHDELAAGGKSLFSAYARQFSISPSAQIGGDMGFYRKGQLPPDFEKIIFSLKAGTFSKVIRSQYGYHIFYLEEKIRAHPQKFWEVRDSIRDKLRLEKERTAQTELMNRLYTRYQPTLFRPALDFNPDVALLNKNIHLEGTHGK